MFVQHYPFTTVQGEHYARHVQHPHPYPIATDIPQHDSPYSSSLSPETPQYVSASGPPTSSSSNTAWDHRSGWSSGAWDTTYEYYQEPETQHVASPVTPYYPPQSSEHYGDIMYPHPPPTTHTPWQCAPVAPPSMLDVQMVYPEANGSPGVSTDIPSVVAEPHAFPYVNPDASMYSHASRQEPAEFEERPPKNNVFDDPLRREDYIQGQHQGQRQQQQGYGSEPSPQLHSHPVQREVEEGREYQTQYVEHAATYQQQQLPVYIDSVEGREQPDCHGSGQQYATDHQHQRQRQRQRNPLPLRINTSIPPILDLDTELYPISPQEHHERKWTTNQAHLINAQSVVPMMQRQDEEPPMEALRPEPVLQHWQPEQASSYPPTITNSYEQEWQPSSSSPQIMAAPVAVPRPPIRISSTSSLSNAIVEPIPQKTNLKAPKPKLTTLAVKRSPSPPNAPAPVPAVPSQSRPKSTQAVNAGSNSTSETSSPKLKSSQSPVPPPRLSRNPRREQSSFRPFHPYPSHQRQQSSSPSSPSSSSSKGKDALSLGSTPPPPTEPITPVFGLFGSYPLALPEGSDTPLPGPTCAPETSSSVMRLVITPALKKSQASGTGGAAGGLGGLAVDANGNPIVPPVVRRPRMACFFCRKRKIACGPGPSAGSGSGNTSLPSPGGPNGEEGSESPVASPITELESEGVGGLSLAPVMSNGQEDDGPCNQCARRGLRCERPTESRRGVRKSRKSASESPDLGLAGATEGAVLLELVPRRKGNGGKKNRAERSNQVNPRLADINPDADVDGDGDIDMQTAHDKEGNIGIAEEGKY